MKDKKIKNVKKSKTSSQNYKRKVFIIVVESFNVLYRVSGIF